MPVCTDCGDTYASCDLHIFHNPVGLKIRELEKRIERIEGKEKQGPFSSRPCANGDQVLMFEGSSIMYLTISQECIKDLCAWLNRKWNSK